MTGTGDLTRDAACPACGDVGYTDITGRRFCGNSGCDRTDEIAVSGDLTRLDMHPDDLLGNENTRALCAHHLGQDTPVSRPTLLKWRRERGFPEPLPCGRAGVELWDARQVRAWVQEYARDLPKTRPANLRKAPGT